MEKRKRISGLLAVGALLAALSLPVYAQDQQDKDQNQRDRMATTLTGCLNKDASGGFVLTDAKGIKTTVAGAAELEKHSSNHQVTLTGTPKTDASGNPIFQVTKLQHVSDTCPAQ